MSWPLVSTSDVQVYGDSPAAQIADPQYATDHISPQRVKYKHFPYRLSICVQDRCRLRYQSVGSGAVERRVGGVGGMVEVQDAFDRGCIAISGGSWVDLRAYVQTYLTISKRLV